MSVFTVIAHQRLDNYAVVQTLTPTDIEPGQSVVLAGLGHSLNGTWTVLFCPQYAYIGTSTETGEWEYNETVTRANQILFRSVGDDMDAAQAGGLPARGSRTPSRRPAAGLRRAGGRS